LYNYHENFENRFIKNINIINIDNIYDWLSKIDIESELKNKNIEHPMIKNKTNIKDLFNIKQEKLTQYITFEQIKEGMAISRSIYIELI
jgi:hypothetical protein